MNPSAVTLPSSGLPDIGVQIWSHCMIPGMVARIVTGQASKQVIDWAKSELEGIRRRLGEPAAAFQSIGRRPAQRHADLRAQSPQWRSQTVARRHRDDA
jgi:hypothetical protein